MRMNIFDPDNSRLFQSLGGLLVLLQNVFLHQVICIYRYTHYDLMGHQLFIHRPLFDPVPITRP